MSVIIDCNSIEICIYNAVKLLVNHGYPLICGAILCFKVSKCRATLCE